MSRLAARTAIVIGGASGFGLATAERFAQEGATVVIAGRRADLAARVGTKLGGSGVGCDITDEAQVVAMVAATLERHGRLDIAVNYAGYEQNTPIRDLDMAALRAMVDVQFLGAVAVIRHAAAAMTEGGSIISVSSLTAHAPSVGQAAYAGSKAALEYVTRIAAVEYGSQGVRVNCIAPHLIETPMTARIFAIPLVIEAVRLQTPMGRMGSVDDVANAALFLASDESGYITGQTLCVDGGASCQKLPSAHDYASLAQIRPDLLGQS